jgi:hypothetical protein
MNFAARRLTRPWSFRSSYPSAMPTTCCITIVWTWCSTSPAARVSAKQAAKPFAQPNGLVGLAQQQGAGVRRDRPAVKAGHHVAALHRWKFEQRRSTLCLHGGVLWIREKPWSQHNSLSISTPMHPIR